MGLIGNGALVLRQPLRLCGVGVSGDFTAWGRGERHNRSIGGFSPVFSAYPNGNLGPKTHILPRKGGAVASRLKIDGSSSLNGSGAMGLNGEASITGVGSLASELQLVVSAIAALSGAGTLNANLAGKLEAVAVLAGTGNMTAGIGALAGIFADIAGQGALTATPRATGNMAAAVTPFTELSPQSLAAAVWDKVIESGLSAEQAMRLIAAATAGEVSGGATSTVTIRNAVADDKNRIVATVDEDGNRTAIIYDLDV